MSSQAPAGWFPDLEDENGLRYWDGNQWTEHRAPMSGQQPNPNQPQSGATYQQPAPGTYEQPMAGALHAPGKPAKKAWWKRTWVIAFAAGLVGIILGSASAGTADPSTTAEYKAVAEERDDAQDNLASTEDDLASAQDDLADTKANLEEIAGDIPAREDTVAKAETDIDKRQGALVKAEAAVSKREKAVGIVETAIKKNTISGDGLYEVGVDIKAGTYKTVGGSDCYYAVLNSTDTFDIANNNNTSGPAAVTVSQGQYLDLGNCADFVWQQ